jgi:RNA polymerase sigma-70 factor (ECF subfamily)
MTLIEEPLPSGALRTLSEDSEALFPGRVHSGESWAVLCRELRPKLTHAVACVLRAVLKRSENPGYAEDIANESLVAAYQKRASYDPARGELYPWLLRIAKNRAYDFLRRHNQLKSELSFDESVGYPSPAADATELLYDTAARPSPKTLALRRALKRLARYDQEILICRFGNALGYEDIERHFNFTVKRSTLRVHVKRAQTRLRRELAKEPAFSELLANG